MAVSTKRRCKEACAWRHIVLVWNPARAGSTDKRFYLMISTTLAKHTLDTVVLLCTVISSWSQIGSSHSQTESEIPNLHSPPCGLNPFNSRVEWYRQVPDRYSGYIFLPSPPFEIHHPSLRVFITVAYTVGCVRASWSPGVLRLEKESVKRLPLI